MLKKILKIIVWIIIILFVLLVLLILLSIGYKPYGEFREAKNDNLNKIKILTQAKPKELLLYRRKKLLNPSSSRIDICYVSYIKLDRNHDITPLKLQNDGFMQVKKSSCVANANNLADLIPQQSAPLFHYLGETKYDKKFLVYGSLKNLDITSISDTQTQIWHKAGYEIIFFPQKNIIRVNRLRFKCGFWTCN